MDARPAWPSSAPPPSERQLAGRHAISDAVKPLTDSLQQTLLEYQFILEHASVGILFTRERKVLHCNPRFSEIYGWPHGELIGQPTSTLYPTPSAYEDMSRVAGPALGRGELLEIERPMQRKDGSIVYCLARAKAINPHNTSEGTIWIVEDITSRRQEQQHLHDLLLKQRAILENASVGILFTRDGEVVHCNPRAEDIYGWPCGTLSGRRAEALFKDGEDYARFGQQVGPQLQAGQRIDVEWLNARQDGSLFWCRNLAMALPSDDGSQSTIWITEDISERKLAQQALADSQRELERRVEERTRELAATNARLQKEILDREMAEQHLRAEESRFRDLTEMLSDWFWEMDAELRFTEMSFGRRQNQLNPRAALGKHRWDLPILGISPGQWRSHRSQLEAHQPFRDFVYQMKTDTGEIHWFSVSGKPVFEHGVFQGYRGTGSDITERKKAEQQIEFLAYHDALTGLPNRLMLQDRVQQGIRAAQDKNSQLALAFLDLDNFKKINDSLGHAAGDALLQALAQRLKDCARTIDTISRQGGDEFVLVLPELPHVDTILPVLRKIMAQLQEPFIWEGHELSSSVSIGIAAYPKDGSDFETLQKKADMAMYRAKEAGRNTYRFFDENMNVEAVEHLLLRNDLRRALERQQFTLYYQPQFDLLSRRIVGVEALLRWQHPDRGMVMPQHFIPVAEESGLIVAIGEWVIREACRQLRQWQEAGQPPLVVAINLSAVQFSQGHLEQTILSALHESGIDPQLLELELTESVLIQDGEQALACVKRLKQLGVKLSIDDFGTGYSSLAYLKRFDIDKLKIDQSFIRDLATDPDDAAIVRAIVQMAKSLGLKAMAEGVENEALLEILQAFGCDEVQGNLLAWPMPAHDLAGFLSCDEPRLIPAEARAIRSMPERHRETRV